jgi:hypothetical protein
MRPRIHKSSVTILVHHTFPNSSCISLSRRSVFVFRSLSCWQKKGFQLDVNIKDVFYAPSATFLYVHNSYYFLCYCLFKCAFITSGTVIRGRRKLLSYLHYLLLEISTASLKQQVKVNY